jgi:hypothetical protein
MALLQGLKCYLEDLETSEKHKYYSNDAGKHAAVAVVKFARNVLKAWDLHFMS